MTFATDDDGGRPGDGASLEDAIVRTYVWLWLSRQTEETLRSFGGAVQRGHPLRKRWGWASYGRLYLEVSLAGASLVQVEASSLGIWRGRVGWGDGGG